MRSVRLQHFQDKDTFEHQVERAQQAIDKHNGDYKDWLQALLDILKQHRFATIISKEGVPIDVQKIAYTYTWASFFDVVNHLKRFNNNIMPRETEELGISRSLREYMLKNVWK